MFVVIAALAIAVGGDEVAVVGGASVVVAIASVVGHICPTVHEQFVDGHADC